MPVTHTRIGIASAHSASACFASFAGSSSPLSPVRSSASRTSASAAGVYVKSAGGTMRMRRSDCGAAAIAVALALIAPRSTDLVRSSRKPWYAVAPFSMWRRSSP